ncbi:hypothetical protein SDRG_04200, partial [Saprolegnia diclina VS20]
MDDDGRGVHQALWDAAAQLSPRRAPDDDAVATTTLPFYEHVPPAEALRRLFVWFRSPTDRDGMSRDAFNRLRCAVHSAEVTQEQWTLAMRALGNNHNAFVTEAEFKELFGPPPFFGPTASSTHLPPQLLLVQEVTRMEAFVHFLKHLFERYATDGVTMTFENLKSLRRQAGIATPLDVATWESLCKRVQAPLESMNWMQFASAWHINLHTNKREGPRGFCYPHVHPSDAVHACVADEKVQLHFSKHDVVSRETLHQLLEATSKPETSSFSLLKKRKKSSKRAMTDDEWCAMLENLQAAEYPLHDETNKNAIELHPQRRVKDVRLPTKPHDTIIHTANNLMMYEIAFDELGPIGLQVQSDFFGQCMAIRAIDGQAKKHALIQLNDIVACVDGRMTIYAPASSEADEATRQSEMQAMFDTHGSSSQRIVFLRQEVYYNNLQATDGIRVVLQTYAALEKGDTFTVRLPPGYTPVDPRSKRLRIEFESQLQYELVPEASVEEGIVTITLTGPKGLASHSYMTMVLHGIVCPQSVVAGPGDISHVDGATVVKLYADWTPWQRLVTDAFATKPLRIDESRFSDPSLTPKTLSVDQGDSGITLTSDFYGQCAVVASISPLKGITTILPEDVLSCVSYTNADGVVERVSLIKPFALSSSDATRHFKYVESVLQERASSQTPYTLQFLRLHSFYVQNGLKTTLTFDALTRLEANAVIAIEMPNSDWRAPDFDAMSAIFVKPEGLNVARMHWDAGAHYFEVTLGECALEVGTQLVLELVGVQGPAERTAGPSEITFVGANRMRLELHEHWHSFLGGWSGIASDQLVNVLATLETTPLDLWTVLEYSHLLFRMYADKATSHMTLARTNVLRAAVFGPGNDMDEETWLRACRRVHAAPRKGLDEKQFAVALLQLLGDKVSPNDIQRIYVFVHSVEKLFCTALDLFEPAHVMELHEPSMRALHRAVFQHLPFRTFQDKLWRLGSQGRWSLDAFGRGFYQAQRDGMDPVAAWVKLHYASALFDQFARMSEMQRDNWRDMLKARKSDIILDEDLWTSLCASVVGNHVTPSRGLTKGGFVQAYHSNVLGPVRDAMVDWNYIQAYSIEPTAHQRSISDAVEAQSAVAPEKLRVNDIATKALEALVSTDDIAEEAIKLNIDFKRTDVVEERVIKFKEDALTTNFASYAAARDRGFLHVRVKSVCELRKDDDDDGEDMDDDDMNTTLDEYYVVMYTISSDEWRNEFKPVVRTWADWRQHIGATLKRKALELLRGQRKEPYVCGPHELWDFAESQALAAEYATKATEFLEQTEVDDALRDDMTQLCERFNPYSPLLAPKPPPEPVGKKARKAPTAVPTAPAVDLKAGRAVSRLVTEDASSAGVLRFPEDAFRLFVDREQRAPRQSHVVVKLFKRTKSGQNKAAIDALNVKSRELTRAERSERVIRALLLKTKLHLTHRIHANLGSINSEIQLELSKFKRKEKDLAELQARIHTLRDDVHALELQQPTAASTNNVAPASLIGQVALPLDELFSILYNDSLETDDLVMLLDTDRHVAGKMLLQFQFQASAPWCRPSNQDAPPPPLRLATDGTLDYPSEAPLHVEWATSDEANVAKRDTLCLVRETERQKLVLNAPFFLFYWNTDIGDGQWDCFQSSLKLYSGPAVDKARVIQMTPPSGNDKAQRGTLLLPSSRDLSLPPGTYRLVLMRQEEDGGRKFRSVLGVSPCLHVFVGVNSVHTVFGTTPFVDVKTVRCAMAIVDNATDNAIASTLPALNATEPWLRAASYEIELVNAIAMLRTQIESLQTQLQSQESHPAPILEAMQMEVEAYTNRVDALEKLQDQGIDAIRDQERQVCDDLQRCEDQLAQCEAHKRAVVAAGNEPDADVSKTMQGLQANIDDLNETKTTLAMVVAEYLRRQEPPAAVVAAGSGAETPVFTYSSYMRVDCLLQGEAAQLPHSQSTTVHDYVIVLPQVVVETADKLRVKILGKLQSMNVERSQHVRDQIQIELQILLRIVEISNAWLLSRIFSTREWYSLYGQLAQLRWLYIFEECYPVFQKAPSEVRLLFPFILQELADELQSRSHELELALPTRVVNATLSLREVPVTNFTPAGGDVQGRIDGSVASFVGLDPNWRSWTNYLRRFFGLDPCLGGMYIAKYIRRGGEVGNARGELGRVGPFAINVDADEAQLWFLAPEKRLLYTEMAFHLGVTALKYFVALLNLSFNVNFVANLVASSSWFSHSTEVLKAMKADCTAALANVLSFVSVVIGWFDYVFSYILNYIMVELNFFDKYVGCGQGYILLLIWVLMWLATLFLYIVIQEDVLVKVQKISYYLPFNVGRVGEDRLEQLGALLVSPVLIVIKVLVLFIAKQWHAYSEQASTGSLFSLTRYSTSGVACPAMEVNYAFQVVSAVLLGGFFYFLLPLLVLDIYSWKPPTDLAKDADRLALSHRGGRHGIWAAVANNVNLVEPPTSWPRRCCCHPFQLFWFAGRGKRLFRDYRRYDFYKLTLKYGFVGIWFVILYIYSVLMLQAVARALGAVFGWRGRADYMYDKPHLRPYGTSHLDRICCRFNWYWRRSWVVQKVLQPMYNCALVTIGAWTTGEWTTYDIEERAKNCFPMEPNNEIKQLQMMSLHGKVNSLIWLPFPVIGFLAYVSDILNRGPILSYLLNRMFLQVDKPANERDPSVRWKIHRWMPECVAGKRVRCGVVDDKTVCLPDTCFYTTLAKWGSSVLELAMVVALIAEPLQNPNGAANSATMKWKAQVALLAATIAPLIELNQQALKSYKKFLELRDTMQSTLVSEGKSLAQQQAGRVGAPIEMASAANAEVQTLLGTNDENDGNSSDEAESDDENDDDDGSKDLIVLTATPETSFVIQSDQLDEGEGVITVNWRVNASRRFHAFDAIGMFPKRSLADTLVKRTMDECLCYRLVSELRVEPFGWRPTTNAHGNELSSGVHSTKMLQHALFLDKVTQHEIGELSRKSIHQRKASLVPAPDSVDAIDAVLDAAPDAVNLDRATFVLENTLASGTIEPYGKQMSEMFHDEMHEKQAAFRTLSVDDADDHKAGGSKDARDTRRVSGQVKFRPANSNEHDDHPQHEDYVFGNSAGIFPCKYGLERYEFFYLKYTGHHTAHSTTTPLYEVVVDSSRDNDAKDRNDPIVETRRGDYEPLVKFTSNAISIGTFDLFIRLTSDTPLVWANQAVNLTWEIFGVNYRVLSHPRNRNCIAFFKVRDIHNTRMCAKVDIVPPSAFLEPHGGGPVSGRMLVFTPSEPGMYEIRFLFNYFHEAKLHRRCQVFGQLEEQMQLQRIKYLFQRRDLARTLSLLQQQTLSAWTQALVYTYAWLHPVLSYLLDKPVPDSVVNNPGLFTRYMVREAAGQLALLAETDHSQLQGCLTQLLSPLRSRSFIAFFGDAFNGSEEMRTHASTIEFVSPSDATRDVFLDAKTRSIARWPAAVTVSPEIWLLHDDKVLLDAGPDNFEALALEYLSRPLLPGRVDILDELILDNRALLTTAKLVVESVATAACGLYEPAIASVVQSFLKQAKQAEKLGLFQDLAVPLQDESRNHIQRLIRALFETHSRSGDRFVGWDTDAARPQLGLDVLQHQALRAWLKPKCVQGIVKVLKRRFALLTASNSAVALQLVRATATKFGCRRPTVPLVSTAAVGLRRRTGKSVVYFLREAETNEATLPTHAS